MKDGAEFNIYFVSLIRKYACLYDANSIEYSNRNAQEWAWEAIAKEVSDSVPACKERWKNLRRNYNRYLKACSISNEKKPYYLTDHLDFLQPFMKYKVLESNSTENSTQPACNESEDNFTDTKLNNFNNMNSFTIENIKIEPDFQFDECISTNDQLQSNNSQESTLNQYEQNSSSLPKRCKISSKLSDENNQAVEYNDKTHETNEEDLDLYFLKSMIPDLKQMSLSQKRRFKIGVLTLAENILNENKNLPSNQSQS